MNYSSKLDQVEISNKNIPWLTAGVLREVAGNSKIERGYEKIKTAESEQFTKELNPIELFISQIVTKDSVPTVQEFIDLYIDTKKDALRTKWANKYERKRIPSLISFDAWLLGVRARLYRTIMTVLTELHAQLLCEENVGGKIYRTLFLDRNGVDWVIEADKNYAIRCHVDNPRARGFLINKLHYKNKLNLTDYFQIDLPYSLDETSPNFGERLNNGFVLCTLDHIARIDRITRGRVNPIRVFSTDANLFNTPNVNYV